MVHVRLGSTWKQDPALKSALARGGNAAREAAFHAVDALALEVDGVDVSAGLAEGALVSSMESLCEGVLRLLAGRPRAQVHFGESNLELVLERRCGSALLTVVTLGRPARVVASKVEVELAELARATRETARDLAAELGALKLDRAALTPLRDLASRLEVARTAPDEAPSFPACTTPPKPHTQTGAPTCVFELYDEVNLIGTYLGPGPDLGSLLVPGRVVVRAADGREALCVSGMPFLTLRDLFAFASRLADAVRRGESRASGMVAGPGRQTTIALEADLAADRLARSGGPELPCPPLLLARALLEAAVDFCGVAAARNPWQAGNGYLAELRSGAAETLAHVQELLTGDVVTEAKALVRNRRPRPLPRAPLGPGHMRKLAFRRAWETDAGAPVGFGVAFLGDLVVAAGASAVLGLDARRGVELWRRGGVRVAALGGGALFLSDGERLVSLDWTNGRERWSREQRDELGPELRDVVRLSGGLALAVTASCAEAIDPSCGETLWTFAPPAAHDLRATAAGTLAVVGSGAGFLYGVEASTGTLAWRLRLPGPLTAPPAFHRGSCLALCATELGGSLVVIDLAAGKRRFEVPLDVTPSGAAVPFAGLLGVAGSVAGDPVVVAVDPAGRLSWENAPPLGTSPIVLASVSSGLLAKTPPGACALFDREGGALWLRAPTVAHPPPANAPPLVARGVALVAGEQAEALELATGRLLGELPLPAPVRLAADGELNACGMDAEGIVTSARLEMRLSVL
ncbi:MAG TPA: PQQ-binding-like beta-propeller repeat protein [Anaeromyxobacteraceae bacterium]|nr:PQQ-binding-like beta-propeller repeat protein [Anaeromyxobacteraceae bacterium]